MNKTIAGMLVLCTFNLIIQILRNPERFDEKLRLDAVKALENWKDRMQQELTGELMSEAVRDVPDAKS